MSKDDSYLYTGASSASFGSSKEQESTKKKKDEKKDKRDKLRPSAEVVIDELQKEMQSVMFIQNIDIKHATDEKMFMIEMMARQKYVEYIQQLQNKITNILREPKSKDERTEEE